MSCPKHGAAYRNAADARLAASLVPVKRYPTQCKECGGWWLAKSRPKGPVVTPRPLAVLPMIESVQGGAALTSSGVRVRLVMADVTKDRQPLLSNHLHRTHWAMVAKKVSNLRAASRMQFEALARDQGIGRTPWYDTVAVTGRAIVGPRTHTVDAAAIAPSIKAMLDGAVDAGVIVDDNPRFVLRESYYPPWRSDRWAIEMAIDRLEA